MGVDIDEFGGGREYFYKGFRIHLRGPLSELSASDVSKEIFRAGRKEFAKQLRKFMNEGANEDSLDFGNLL